MFLDMVESRTRSMPVWSNNINFVGIGSGRIHVGFSNRRGDKHRISFAVEDGQAPNSVVEDAIESFGALVCAAGAGQTGHGDGGTMDISVAFTSSGSSAETGAGLRRYVEQVYDLSLCPVRLRDALAYAVVGWRQKHRADAAVCSECPFVPKSD